MLALFLSPSRVRVVEVPGVSVAEVPEVVAAAPLRVAGVAGTLSMIVFRFIEAGSFLGSGLSRTASAEVAGVGLPMTRRR